MQTTKTLDQLREELLDAQTMRRGCRRKLEEATDRLRIAEYDVADAEKALHTAEQAAAEVSP